MRAYFIIHCSLLVALSLSSAAGASYVETANASVDWLDAEACPQFGYALDINSLATQEQRREAMSEAMQQANNADTAIQHASAQRSAVLRELQAKGRAPSSRVQGDIDDLDAAIRDKAAGVAVAMTRWTQAQWINLAYTDPDYHYGVQAQHPLAPFVAAGKDLDAVTARYRAFDAASGWLSRIAAKYRQCLVEAQHAVLSHNEAVIASEAQQRDSVQALQALKNAYFPVSSVQGGRGNAHKIAVIDARIQELNDVEAAKRRERDRIANAEAEAARQARMDEARKMLPLAQTFVAGINASNINKAGSVLHQNIVISAPNQQGRTTTTRGKQQALQRLRQGFSSGNGGSTSAPSLHSNGTITARVLTQKGRATMSFSFTNGAISRVNIAR